MRYFISGHRDITQEEFDKNYKKAIDEVISNDPFPTFVVGDYCGADIMAQNYLKEIIDNGDGTLSESDVEVFHMFEFPRNYAFKDNPGVKCNGGFICDEERDAAMTNCTDYDIAYVRGERWDSGTAQNIKRRHILK